jgi:hypothetical protein
MTGANRSRRKRATRGFSYCIAGTQKAGTSTLSWLLGQHTHIQRAPRKEMHYFDNEDKDWTKGDFSDLAVPARGKRRRIVGDATPTYLWWPRAVERIHAYNPQMKMIAVFRDPIERLVSQWVMLATRYTDIDLDWPDFLTRLAPDGLDDRIPDGVSRRTYRICSGVVRGYYGAQLERGFALLGREQFHLIEFRAFIGGHAITLDRVTDFLEVPRFDTHPSLLNAYPGTPTAVGTAPTGKDVEYLVERYCDDFEKFKLLSGLDVSEWPLQRLIDGDLDPALLADQLAARFVPPGSAD